MGGKSTACLVFEYRVRSPEPQTNVREQYMGSTEGDKKNIKGMDFATVEGDVDSTV